MCLIPWIILSLDFISLLIQLSIIEAAHVFGLCGPVCGAFRGLSVYKGGRLVIRLFTQAGLDQHKQADKHTASVTLIVCGAAHL